MKEYAVMAKGVAWTTFVLGLVHIVFGIVKFQGPLGEAVSAGFIDQFSRHDARRAAFWFLVCGPFLMLMGHIAIRAVAAGDRAVLKIMGVYALMASVVCIAAFPASPLWSLLVLSLLLIAAGGGGGSVRPPAPGL
jgi:hypothetical protein